MSVFLLFQNLFANCDASRQQKKKRALTGALDQIRSVMTNLFQLAQKAGLRQAEVNELQHYSYCYKPSGSSSQWGDRGRSSHSVDISRPFKVKVDRLFHCSDNQNISEAFSGLRNGLSPFSFLRREMNFLGGMTPTFFFCVAMEWKRSARHVRRFSFFFCWAL